MTLSELIEQLTALQEEHGPDVEVFLAQQPRWPFQYALGDVVAVDANAGDREDIEDFLREAEPDDPDVDAARAQLAELASAPVVYIGEGAQLAYLSGDVTKALGWR